MAPLSPGTSHPVDLRAERARRLPLALARVHQALAPGTAVELVLSRDRSLDGDGLAAIVEGAGFDADGTGVDRTGVDGDALVVAARRARTLPDTVGRGMRLLVCGLNPSLYAADRGVGYARPGNRFWPAALAAGLVRRDRDPLDALEACGVGLTDLVKRATTGAAELLVDEYRSGAGRVERMVRWLQPGAVCFVGLAGWRAAIDPKAGPGRQPGAFGGRPAYVMPSTSGLNARTSLDCLVDHLRAAAALGGRVTP